MNRAHFGKLSSGQSVERIRLENDQLIVDILDYGATIADIQVKSSGSAKSVVLGFSTAAEYEEQPYYFGTIAGRCANRIRGGHAIIAGKAYQLSVNNNGRNHLHGGTSGFNRKLWITRSADDRSVSLTLRSPDGDEGYPGTVDVTCRYSIEHGDLVIDLTATTDAPTLVNLAAHSYFNLDASDSILDHRLALHADAYTPVDEYLIPTGEISPVADGPYDFRQGKRVSQDFDQLPGGYDTNFVTTRHPTSDPHPVARLEGTSGTTLELLSTEPGLQFYTGGFLKPGMYLADGRPVKRFGGLCLEPQRFPDAVHHPEFPGSRLDPGEIYHQRTIYRFTA